MLVKRNILPVALLTVCTSLASAITPTDDTYIESDGLVIMEAENTTSPLRLWVTDTSINDYSGESYLEFTGNNPIRGRAKSPLKYTFTVNKPGLYHLHMRCARERYNGRNDVANDCFVRVEGDYTAGPPPYDRHGKNAALEVLQTNTKFFGGLNNQWQWASGARLDLGGHRNKRKAVYNFKAGETYQLVVSGRSQLYKLDRIIFRHNSVNSELVNDLSLPESQKNTPDLGPGLDLNRQINSVLFDEESHPGDDNFVWAINNRVARNYNETWISFKDFDFGNGDFDNIYIEGGSDSAGGNVEVRVDSPTGPLLGTIAITNTGGLEKFQSFAADLITTTGVKDLYLVSSGGSGRLFNLRNFSITTKNIDISINAIDFDGESHPGIFNFVTIFEDTVIRNIHNTWIRFNDVVFGDGVTSIDVEAATIRDNAKVELRLGSPSGRLIGTINLNNTGSWDEYQTHSVNNKSVIGVHDLYLVAQGTANQRSYNLKSITINR